MNRRKLERWLVNHNCFRVRHGAGHDLWGREGVPAHSAVPRHGEVKAEIVRSICRRLGIPLPPEK